MRLFEGASVLFGVGIVGLLGAIIGAGAWLAATLNIAWLFAAGFAVLLVLTTVGGYRLWSVADKTAAQAQSMVTRLTDEAAARIVSPRHQAALIKLIRRFRKLVGDSEGEHR